MLVSEWILTTWQEAGGLIPKALAAEILLVSITRIDQLVKCRKIRSYQYSATSRPLVSYADTLKERHDRHPEYKRRTKKSPSTHADETQS